jgi:hypothetical protein
MIAFGAGPSSDVLYVSQWRCLHYLPRIECDVCGEMQWSADVWYPSFSVAKKADAAKFSDEVTVTVKEFDALSQLVRCKGWGGSRLQPAAGIGCVHAKLPKRKSDFYWCEGRPIVSRRALEVLSLAGFNLTTGPVIHLATGSVTEYRAWQVPVVALYTDRLRKQLTLVQCAKCGGWNLQDPRTKLSVPREYMAVSVPEASGMVRPEEGAETLATDRFIATVRSERLTGIEFKEWGVYV